jgi:hypothetical protein
MTRFLVYVYKAAYEGDEWLRHTQPFESESQAMGYAQTFANLRKRSAFVADVYGAALLEVKPQ